MSLGSETEDTECRLIVVKKSNMQSCYDGEGMSTCLELIIAKQLN